MRLNVLNFSTLFLCISCLSFAYAADPIDGMKNVAAQFVKLVDKNDADQLKKLLHPNMVQHVQMGGKLIPFNGSDFIQMVADKKLGGKPRKIEFHSANVLRGQTGQVILRAVSDEYDFMYQLAMAKDGDNWIITGVLVDILEA